MKIPEFKEIRESKEFREFKEVEKKIEKIHLKNSLVGKTHRSNRDIPLLLLILPDSIHLSAMSWMINSQAMTQINHRYLSQVNHLSQVNRHLSQVNRHLF